MEASAMSPHLHIKNDSRATFMATFTSGDTQVSKPFTSASECCKWVIEMACLHNNEGKGPNKTKEEVKKSEVVACPYRFL